jgi:hypothetical protein
VFKFQEYWHNYNEFCYEYKANKDYKKALTYFKWMENNGSEKFPNSGDYLDAAICFVKLGDTAKATNYLRESVLHGFLNIDEDNGWAKNELGEKMFSVIRAELPELKRKYYISIAPSVAAKIAEEKRYGIDQFVRSSAVTKTLSLADKTKLCHVADSINISELITAIKRNEASPQSALIYHLYDENQQYVPFIDSCLKVYLYAGKGSPEAYGFWYDRQRVYVEKKPQKYGTYIVGYPPILGEIANVDSVDFYRSQIGLPPLWKSALEKKFDLPKGYQKK